MDDVKIPSSEERKSALSGLGLQGSELKMLVLLKVRAIM